MTRKNRLKAKVTPYAHLFEAIGHVQRLAIVHTLAYRPMDVREIIDVVGISPALMTHHLNKLFSTGWVDKRKYGKRVEYRLVLKNIHALEELLKESPVYKESL